MENKMMCSVCGKEENRYEMVKLNGEWFCVDCLDERYFYCEEHRDYEPIENRVEITDVYDNCRVMCQEAFDENYITCDECGRPMRRGDEYVMGDDILCSHCYEERKIIKYYHYHHGQELYFHGTPSNGIFFGLEIESERDYNCDLDRNLIALSVQDKVGSDKVYFEEDGSLDDGFETITYPMSYEFMRNNFVVEDILETLRDNEMYASDRCGLHIHVTKTDEVVKAMPLILSFLESNKNDIVDFSRRTYDSFTEWCDFYTEENLLTAYEAERICLRPQGRRHMCINFTNEHTIEFRCFAGTLDAKRVYGYIEFILALIENIEHLFSITERPTFKDLEKVSGFDLFKENLVF